MKEALLSAPVISGACLLTHEEIIQLSGVTMRDDLQRMCASHPNAEDLLYGGFPLRNTPFPLYYWFETKEFAELVKMKTHLPFETALGAFIEEAHRIGGALQLAPCVSARFLYTHEPEVSERLSHLAEKYAATYLQFIDERDFTLPGKLRRLIRETPGRCNFLRVLCTYSPEAIGEQTAVVIEPANLHIPTSLGSFHQASVIIAAEELFGVELVLLKG